MKKLIAVMLVGVMLLVPGVALASDVSKALYLGIVTVTNNSTASNDVFTTFPLSTQGLIDSNFLSENLTDCAMVSAGVDVAFMPSVNATYPWCLYVSHIGENASKNYLLYTGGQADMGGKISYFPAAGGMTSLNSGTLELSDNFTIEQRGWIDTDAGADKNLVYKEDAFKVYVSPMVSGNITVELTSTPYTFYPDAHIEATSVDGYVEERTAQAWAAIWADGGDNSNDEGVELNFGFSTDTNPNYKFMRRAVLLFDTSSLPDTATIVSATLLVYGSSKQDTAGISPTVNVFSSNPALDTDLVNADYISARFGAVPFSTAITYAAFDAAGYNTFALNAAGIASVDATGITKLAIREATYEAPNAIPNPWPGNAKSIYFRAWTADKGADFKPTLVIGIAPLSVTATGVESGNHTIRVLADTANLTISIDGATSGNLFDTTALAGGAWDNNNNWTFIENYSMPYMEYHKIWIDGVLQQHIEYEYDDTVFSDLSEQSHPAYPTFRGASSDADVSGVLASWGPLDESQAPPWVLETERAFISDNITVTGEFTTTPTPTAAPGVAVIVALSEATGTPAQLPFTVLAGFVIVAMSITTTWFMAKHGSRNIWMKIMLIGICMAVCIGVGVLDFWMLVFFIIMATAVALFSRQRTT